MEPSTEDLWLYSEDEESEEMTTASVPVAVHILICFLLIWQSCFHVSDGGLASLVLFFHHFFRTLSATTSTNSSLIRDIASFWPRSSSSLHKLSGIQKADFREYVVCPKCDSIYDYAQCVMTKANGEKESKLCQHCKYPQHPHLRLRQPCEVLLLQTAHSKRGKSLRPWKTYSPEGLVNITSCICCYYSVILALKELLVRPGVLELCECRSSDSENNVLGDVCDGDIWKELCM